LKSENYVLFIEKGDINLEAFIMGTNISPE